PRQRRPAARREATHTKAELLHGGPGQGSADLGDQPADVAVGGGLMQRAQRWTKLMAATGAQSGEPIVRVRRGGKLGEVQFEQKGRPVTGQCEHAPNRKRVLGDLLSAGAVTVAPFAGWRPRRGAAPIRAATAAR